jgi:Arc/MetJ-type ribon-helix-helix transcriptional regulator
MPRPGPRRPLVSFKLDQSAIDWIDRLASERGENRSETIRTLLSYASRMPALWRPPPAKPAEAATPRVDEPFQCQLGHRQPVMVTDSTYRQHVKRAHRAEARELGWLK